MSLPYPESTVWYIEARSTSHPRTDGRADSTGSGVVLWLQNRDETDSRGRYLLTCAHVVRGPVPGSTKKDHEAGFGPLLEDLRVWEPGKGFAPAAALAAHVAQDIKPEDLGPVPPHARVAVRDWVILSVDDETFRNSALAVNDCVDPAESQLSIWGYPGGSAGFAGHLVNPAESAGLRFKDHHQRVIRLHGDESRAGMSGGGVFNEAGDLVGIHRSRLDPILECHALSATFIREELAAAGYEIVPSEHIGPPTSEHSQNWTRRAVIAGSLGAAVLAAWQFVDPQPTPPNTDVTCHIYDSSTHDRIRREFEIYDPKRLNSNRYRSDGFVCTVPAEFLTQPEALRFNCKGYETTPPSDCPITSDTTTSAQGLVRKFCLERNADEYFDAVCPALRNSVPVSDNDIVRLTRLNDVDPAQVTLLVWNDTECRPDLIFIPLFTSADLRARELYGGGACIPIVGNEIDKGKKWAQPEVSFDDSPGVFAVFISFEGEPPELIGFDAIYQKQFLLIKIEDRRLRDKWTIACVSTDPR